jgi:hypothetical protein
MIILVFSRFVVTKFSAGAILPIWAVLGGARILSSKPLQLRIFSTPHAVIRRWAKMGSLIMFFVSAVAFGYVALWSAYGFRNGTAPPQLG